MFNIDWFRYVMLELVHFWRKNNWARWLNIVVEPIRDIHKRFYLVYQDEAFYLKHTGQTMSLEHLLNSEFNSGGQIFIENTFIDELEYDLFKYMGGPDYIQWNHQNPQELDIWTSMSIPSYDFTVFIPGSLQGSINEDKLKIIVEDFKAAGKRYQLKYY